MSVLFRVIQIFRSGLGKFALPFAESSIAILMGILIGALFMIVLGYDPVAAYFALFRGAFGTVGGWLETLAFATPLMLTAITFAVGMKTGIFNIGAEGQVYLGAVGAAWVGGWIALPTILHVAAATVFGMLLGAFWALPAALLKIWKGVHEVISTIMLNWIGYYLAIYLAIYFLTGPRGEITKAVMVSARYPILVEGASLTSILFVAIVFCIAIYMFLWRAPAGYELRLVGSNPRAATYAGVRVRRAILFSFIIGGLAAGLAGAAQVIGRSPSWALYTNMSNVLNLGFIGIGVALIGRKHPIGGVFAAIFYGGVLHGGRFMEYYANVPSELVMFIQGIIVIALAVPELLKVLGVRSK